MKNKNIGMILLAAYLISTGVVALLHVSLGVVPAILATAAGVMILLGK